MAENSILNDVKAVIGIMDDYGYYDPQIIMHINTMFEALNQMGVGPEVPYHITGVENTWDEFTTGSVCSIESVKTYIGLRVRIVFDPPNNSSLIEATNKLIEEFEWRLRFGSADARNEGI